jgi:hypothetical protein
LLSLNKELKFGQLRGSLEKCQPECIAPEATFSCEQKLQEKEEEITNTTAKLQGG